MNSLNLECFFFYFILFLFLFWWVCFIALFKLFANQIFFSFLFLPRNDTLAFYLYFYSGMFYYAGLKGRKIRRKRWGNVKDKRCLLIK